MELLRLNKNIYQLDFIKKAIKELGNLADFKINEANEYFEVEINNCDGGTQAIIKDELANYILAMHS